MGWRSRSTSSRDLPKLAERSCGSPTDLPVFAPLSLVDSGESDSGRQFVVLQHPATAEAVRGFLARPLPPAGWRSEGGSIFRKEKERRVEISVEAIGALSRFRVVV